MTSNNNTLHWTDYEDGSGDMTTKYGRKLFSYDKSTDEIQYPNGQWQTCNFDENWKQQYETYYHDKIEPNEIKYIELMKHNIVLPYFNDITYKKDKEKADYIALDDTHVMSISEFENVATSIHNAENKHFSSNTASDSKIANMIASAITHNRISNDKYMYTYENENHSFTINSIHKMSDIIPNQKQREIPEISMEHTETEKQLE